MSVYRFQHPVARLPIVILALALVSACAASNPDVVSRDGINDPNEARNRKVHAFNIKLDKAILRPAGQGYSKAVPDEFEDSINNFATNLAQPSMMVNSLLQGDFRGAGLSTNTTQILARPCMSGVPPKGPMSNCRLLARPPAAMRWGVSLICLPTR